MDSLDTCISLALKIKISSALTHTSGDSDPGPYYDTQCSKIDSLPLGGVAKMTKTWVRFIFRKSGDLSRWKLLGIQVAIWSTDNNFKVTCVLDSWCFWLIRNYQAAILPHPSAQTRFQTMADASPGVPIL